MPVFEEFPYTNFHELNLDWIIQKVHDLAVEYVKTQNELKALEEDFINLKNYVDNYFASTDFAELADEVLHEMLTNGDLTTLFAQYTLRIYSNVAEMKADTLLIDGSRAKTLGYNYASDKGSGMYFITADTSISGFYETLNNGLRAYLVKENSIYLGQVGIQENTDITSIMQTALDNYSEIYLPRGTYYTNGVLNITHDNVHIDLGGSTFNQTLNANGAFISCSRVNFFKVENGTINYPTNPNTNNTPTAITLYQTNGSEIRRITINKPFGMGIAIENAINCIISDCEVSYAQVHRAGVWIGSNASYNTIERLFSHHNDLDGLINAGSHCVIKDSHFAFNGSNPDPTSGALGACGIYVEPNYGQFCHYENNLCEYNTESGIDAKGRFFEIISNQCTNNGLSGIVLSDFSWGASVTENKCISNGQSPTTQNPTIWGKSGINTRINVQNVVIANNVCFSGDAAHQDYGIKALAGTNNGLNIIGNVCSNNVLGGIDVTESTTGQILQTGNIT